MTRTKTGKAKKTNGKTNSCKPGVIATIISTISRANGATAEECLEVLKAKFPERDPDGMMKTIGIQASKNAKRKDRTEKRGLIYYCSK